MKKLTWPFLFILVFLASCSSKGKYNGSITLSWNDTESREDDSKIIEERLKKIGIKKYSIRILNAHEIKIEMQNVKDTSRLLELIASNEILSFWECYENKEAFEFLNNLDRRLGAMANIPDSLFYDGLMGDSAQQAQEKLRMLKNPLWTHLQYASFMDENEQLYLADGAAVGNALIKDTAFVDSLLRIGYKVILPKDMLLAWTLLPQNDSIFTLIALKRSQGKWGAFMTQESIERTRLEDNKYGQGKVLTIKFDKKGADLWEKITKKNTGRCIAITLGNKVVSYPRVEGTITGGVASITGPGVEDLKIIQMASQMKPFKTTPRIIFHHFEEKK